jgi:hypothetical protein
LTKQIYFLTGLPRSGNTLLSSIINKNKSVKITANSILPTILYSLKELKNNNIFLNFPDHKSFDNVIFNVFNNYYKNWNCDIIIDRGPWGTPANLNILKTIFNELKFIILHRPVLEILASFIKIEKPSNVEYRCDQLMDKEGIVGKYLWSIENIIEKKEKFIDISYDNLIVDTKNQIQKIYNFLNINEEIILNNLELFNVNNISYNDNIFKCNLHEIRTDLIKKINYNIEDYLPLNIIKKYSNKNII